VQKGEHGDLLILTRGMTVEEARNLKKGNELESERESRFSDNAARDLNGKLFPFGWAKLLYRLKVKGTSSARLVLLGLRKDMRAKKRYGALSTAMYAELAYRGMKKPQYKWAELSWTLEDNRPINLGIKAMRAQIYKTYRVYEKAL